MASAAKSGERTLLEQRLDYTFHDASLLELALTHSSLAFESGTATHNNERMEFLGDAVVGLLVADALYERFAALGEGDLTRMRALLVSRKHLGEVGARLGLGDHLLLGRGEEKSGGRKKPALLANAMEALLAAVYRDGGLDAARTLVDREVVTPKLPELELAAGEQTHFGGVIGDYKSALQELLQANGQSIARYVTSEESGPDHRKHFRVHLVLVEDAAETLLAVGEGTTKKAAQQRAAEVAFSKLKDTRASNG